MSSKTITIDKKEFNAISQIIGHIYGGTYENLFQDEMKEEGEINFTDDELAETLDGLIKKWFRAEELKKNTYNDDCWQCRAPMDFCSCTCDLCRKKSVYCNC